MKNTKSITTIKLLLVSALCACSTLLNAATYSPATVPDPKQFGQDCYVSNPDSILNADDVAYLNQCCRLLEDTAEVEMAIVVLESIGNYEPFDFGFELFNRWGIGKAGKNTGVLVTFALASRQVYINTGSGIEGVLPDAICKKIIQEDMIPRFKQGDYGGGLCAAATHIYTICSSDEAPEELLNMASATNRGKFAKQAAKADDNSLTPSEWGALIIFMFLVMLPMLLIVLVQRKTQTLEDEREQRMGCLVKMAFVSVIFWPLIPTVLWFWWRSKRYRCPECGKQRYQIICTDKTELKNGDTKKVETWICTKCGYKHVETNIVKKPMFSGGYSGGYSDSYSGGSSYSSSSSSSGGSWGGGSSSGGGAGGSW